MTLDSILAAALLAMFLGWHLVVLLTIIYYLARSFIQRRIESIVRIEQREADTGMSRLDSWADKSFATKAGHLAYDIGRRLGMGVWQKVVEASDLVNIMSWGLVVVWEYCDRRGGLESQKSC